MAGRLRLRDSVAIRAPAALVFEWLSRPERLPAWNQSVEWARPLGEGSTTLGSRALARGRFLGVPIESETEVIQFDPPRLFGTRSCRGPSLETSFHLTMDAFGTTLTVELAGEPPGGRLGLLVAEPRLRTDLARSLARLKELTEAAARERAESQPLDGGDPACWLHLPPDTDLRP